MSRPHLYNWHPEGVTLHSGSRSPFLVDCQALTVADWDSVATYVVHVLKIEFSAVIGIPRGGLRFAAALEPYRANYSAVPLLLTDDVLTTGRSMEEYKATFPCQDVIGVVLYARGPCPEWVTPIWRLEASHDAS
jgi:hypothetical protein